MMSEIKCKCKKERERKRAIESESVGMFKEVLERQCVGRCT